jgi:hypothetical protein
VPGIHIFDREGETWMAGTDDLTGLAGSNCYCTGVILNPPECSPLATFSTDSPVIPPTMAATLCSVRGET